MVVLQSSRANVSSSSMVDVYRQRLELLREQCQKYGNKSSFRLIFPNKKVNEKHNYLYCYVEKVSRIQGSSIVVVAAAAAAFIWHVLSCLWRSQLGKVPRLS